MGNSNGPIVITRVHFVNQPEGYTPEGDVPPHTRVQISLTRSGNRHTPFTTDFKDLEPLLDRLHIKPQRIHEELVGLAFHSSEGVGDDTCFEFQLRQAAVVRGHTPYPEIYNIAAQALSKLELPDFTDYPINHVKEAFRRLYEYKSINEFNSLLVVASNGAYHLAHASADWFPPELEALRVRYFQMKWRDTFIKALVTLSPTETPFAFYPLIDN
jgi:hypothetical protein